GQEVVDVGEEGGGEEGHREEGPRRQGACREGRDREGVDAQGGDQAVRRHEGRRRRVVGDVGWCGRRQRPARLTRRTTTPPVRRRLDVELVLRGLAAISQRARELIAAGLVTGAGAPTLQP